jgi:hypothetical protein
MFFVVFPSSSMQMPKQRLDEATIAPFQVRTNSFIILPSKATLNNPRMEYPVCVYV